MLVPALPSKFLGALCRWILWLGIPTLASPVRSWNSCWPWAKINDPSLRRWRWKDFRQERSIKGEIQDFYDASTVKCLNVSQEIALGHQLTKRSCCMRQLGKNSAIHIQILHLPSSQKKTSTVTVDYIH